MQNTMGSGTAALLLVVGLLIGAGVTYAVVPMKTATATNTTTQTATLILPAQTSTSTATLTLVQVPVMQTQVETITDQVTGVKTLTYTFTETSLTTASSPLGTIPLQYLPASYGTSPVAFYISAGILNVTISSSAQLDFNIMNSALFTQHQGGQSVPTCSTPSCNLDQDGAKVGITSGSLFFQITTPGTYYTWEDNAVSGTWLSGSLGTASTQTVTNVVTSTSLSTTTATSQSTTTVTSTSYSTSTVG